MTRLSSEELRLMRCANDALVSALEHERLDDWRRACARTLKAVAGAEHAMVMTAPEADERWALSEDLSASEMERYWALHLQGVDGGLERVRARGVSVVLLRDIVDGDWDGYREDRMVQEFHWPNQQRDCIGLTAFGIPTEGGISWMEFHSTRYPTPRLERGKILIRRLAPAFKTGLLARATGIGGTYDSARALDRLDVPVLLVSASGRIAFRTRGVAQLLMNPRHEAQVLGAVAHLVRTQEVHLRGTPRRTHLPLAPTALRVQVQERAFTLRATPVGPEGSATRLTMVLLEEHPAPPPSDAEVREAFKLSMRELHVARLMSRGMADKEIARELGVSWHTARRHAEHVLRKTGVTRRSLLADRLNTLPSRTRS
ncbi:MAG: helix-turn-helix transcriptional regulator [Gemmatimonadetes bacterium]|nr:helix-turn-helix transcriptional regulator [Gemmatimonadota bacterium]